MVQADAREHWHELTVAGPIAKQVLDMDIDFSKGQVANINADEINVTIPLKQGENGDFYQIYVFLEVTQKELAYNRRNPQQ